MVRNPEVPMATLEQQAAYLKAEQEGRVIHTNDGTFAWIISVMPDAMFEPARRAALNSSTDPEDQPKR